jgi:hypothetical protein
MGDGPGSIEERGTGEEVPEQMGPLAGVSPQALGLFYLITRGVKPGQLFAVPSRNELSRLVGQSRRSVIRHLGSLLDAGMIKRHDGAANVFRLSVAPEVTPVAPEVTPMSPRVPNPEGGSAEAVSPRVPPVSPRVPPVSPRVPPVSPRGALLDSESEEVLNTSSNSESDPARAALVAAAHRDLRAIGMPVWQARRYAEANPELVRLALECLAERAANPQLEAIRSKAGYVHAVLTKPSHYGLEKTPAGWRRTSQAEARHQQHVERISKERARAQREEMESQRYRLWKSVWEQLAPEEQRGIDGEIRRTMPLLRNAEEGSFVLQSARHRVLETRERDRLKPKEGAPS